MAAETEDGAKDVEETIPEEWGWPTEPFQPEDLKQFVYQATEETHQEKWDKQLEARAIDSKLEDHIAEKSFANLMLNKEGTGDEKDSVHHQGIDPNCYQAGRWYRFLNHKGDCYVYVHNYTRAIQASRPPNFKDLTEEEKKRLAQLGTYIKELPMEIERVYANQKAIPIIYCSEECCEALKLFFTYEKGGQLLDATKLKRINVAALEESRRAIVNALKLGKTLCVYLGDIVPDFAEKICISKNKESFPSGVFRYGGLENDLVRERIYRDEDKEGGQCVIRPGFQVCVVVMFDGMQEMSSMRKEELPQKIPDFDQMHQMRVYNDSDKEKILSQMRA